MVKHKEIPEQVLKTLEIDKRIQSASIRRLQIQGKPTDIAESFEVWTLPSIAVRRFRANPNNFSGLDGLAVNTQRVHLQIKLDGKKIAYSRAEMPTNSSTGQSILRGKALFVSQKAIRIDDVFNWAKENLRNIDVEARLLLAPQYQVTTFWIFGRGTSRSGIVPIVFPREFNRYFSPIRLVSSEDFLTALYAVGPIEGIRWRND